MVRAAPSVLAALRWNFSDFEKPAT